MDTALTPEQALDAVCARVDAALRGTDVVVVALDGRSGTGKSTIADRLTARRDDVAVVHGDDFYRAMPDEHRRAMDPRTAADRLFDHQRLAAALAELRAGSPAWFRPFDWTSGQGPAVLDTVVEPAPVVVVEGVYSAHPELAHLVDVPILVEVDEATRLARIAARGHGNDEWHPLWDAAESWYFTTVCSPGHFAVRVDTSAR